MSSKKEQDIQMGKENEAIVKPIVESFFSCGDLEQTSWFNEIDWENADYFFELKSRRINHNQYATSIVGANKIEAIKRKNKPNNFILFKYTDGLFYLPYNVDNWNTFSIKEQKVFRDGKWESSRVYHIPYTHLKKIECQ
jgi:hypothetical protein